MLMQRVLVTGIGGVCGPGTSWTQIHAGLRARRNTIRRMPEWDRYTDMNTKLR
jgi:3-oxoacyl-[acyl-carrier-protein] synthase II